MPYGNQDGPSMESAKQERKDLLRDNPVVRDMDSSRPWISKHFQSSMSPLKDGHSGDMSPAEFNQKLVDEANDPESTMDPKFKREVLKAGASSQMKDDSNGMPKLYDAAGHMHTPFHKDKMYHKIEKKLEPKKKEEEK